MKLLINDLPRVVFTESQHGQADFYRCQASDCLHLFEDACAAKRHDRCCMVCNKVCHTPGGTFTAGVINLGSGCMDAVIPRITEHLKVFKPERLACT